MHRLLVVVSVLTFAIVRAGAETRVPDSAVEMTLSFAPVVNEAAPAVVNIYARRVVPERVSPFAGDPFFGEFFRDFGQVVPRVQNALGSGVILDADGIVVSNYHVVGEATDIRVVLNDRREFGAEVVLADEPSDLAVLRLEGAADLPALEPRDSDTLEVGDLVLAIGNPFGVGQTVSSGIVSGLARSGLPVGGGRGYFIQTDAAINPGNSGGALVDMAGRLAGINTAILTRSGGSQGVGFAIPSNLVAQVLEQARAGHTSFQRPWAGAAGQEVDAALADSFDLEVPRGVVLTELHHQSPFREAGLQAGDIVVDLAGEGVNTPAEMLYRLTVTGVGREAEVVYLRDGQQAQARVALIAPPEEPARAPLTITENVALRGLSVETINPAVIAEHGLPLSASGVVVTAAQDRVRRIGLRPGDILLAINDHGISHSQDVARAVREPVRLWQIDLVRDGRRSTLRFRL
jgi:Do/DeqQ family serine protease